MLPSHVRCFPDLAVGIHANLLEEGSLPHYGRLRSLACRSSVENEVALNVANLGGFCTTDILTVLQNHVKALERAFNDKKREYMNERYRKER